MQVVNEEWREFIQKMQTEPETNSLFQKPPILTEKNTDTITNIHFSDNSSDEDWEPLKVKSRKVAQGQKNAVQGGQSTFRRYHNAGRK